jgi:hypothetical protein
VYRDEIVPDEAGRWKIELEIDGPSNVRHELVVGVLDSASQQAVRRWIADHPNQPIRALPEGFQEEARLVVVRE